MSKTQFGHAAAFGVATAMAVIIFALGLYLADLKNSALNYLSYPIALTIAIIGVKKWREQSGGYLTFGKTYAHLMLQTVVYSVLITVWTLIFMLVIAPGMMEDQLLIQQAKMEEQGMPQEQIDIAMHWARKFTQPGIVAVFAFFGNIIFIGLINLIVAAIMKKDPPAPHFVPPADSAFANMPPPNYPPQQ